MSEERYAPYLSFLGIPPEDRVASARRASILPIPYDLTTSYQPGARRGPLAILEASTHLETWDEELGRETWQDIEIQTLPALAPDTRGPAAMMKRIEAAAAEVIDAGDFLIGLGGEHSVSAPLVRATHRRHPGLGVLQLDAHADLRAEFEGSPDNHACVMRRMLDDGLRLAQVGIRSLTGDEHELIRSGRVTTVFAEEAVTTPVESWASRVIDSLPDEVYVTVDLDAFDPGIMPATGTPEPGGLDWYRAVGLLRLVAQRRRIVGFDVVELAPLPGLVAPDFLAAKLVYRLLGYALASCRR